jgi:LacI family transcriptional regulator
MKITHQQIAEEVGVSRTVVTEALHRSPRARINPQTRRKILRVARQRGYTPRNLTTHNIGYVQSIGFMRLEAEADLLMMYETALRSRGYRLMLIGMNEENPSALREVLNAKTVDGVIFSRWYNGAIKEILPPQIPWVLMSEEDGVGPDVDVVALDVVQTACDLTAYLIGYGHEHLGLIHTQADIKFYRDVVAGVKQAMQTVGLPPSGLTLIRPHFVEGLAAELMPIMERPEAPTALIAVSPGQAVATLYLLRSNGYQVPADVSLAAMVDNIRYQALPPALTATDALGPLLVEQVVERLMQKIRYPQEAQRTLVKGQLIERQSVGAPRRRE